MIIDSRSAMKTARQFGYKQVEINDRDKDHMVSFRHDTKCGGVRINVYPSTGTVATCLDRPHHHYAQLARRNMTIQDLNNIFCDPRTHAKRGYQRIGNSGVVFDEDHANVTPNVHYRFDAEHTMDCFGEVTKKDIDSISLGCNSFVILYTDGDAAWSGEIPSGLKNKLTGRQSWLPKPQIIGLAPRSPQTYFIQYTDGQQQWNNLHEDLEMDLKDNDGSVDLIAIGDNDQYYVGFEDGAECWNLPPALSNLLNGRNDTRSRINPTMLAEVTKLSWSEKESIVGFADGTWRWSSAQSEADQHHILNEETCQILNSCEKIYDFQMNCLGDFVLSYKK